MADGIKKHILIIAYLEFGPYLVGGRFRLGSKKDIVLCLCWSTGVVCVCVCACVCACVSVRVCGALCVSLGLQNLPIKPQIGIK